MRRGGLDGTEGEVGGKSPADEVGDGGGEGVDEVEKSDEDDTTEDGVRLGHLRAFFEGVEGGVLGQLEYDAIVRSTLLIAV